MSARADARQALADWLTDGHIEHLDKVHLAYPLRLDFNGYGAGVHRCQAVIYFVEEGELRFALGGEHSGKKRIDYLVSLEVYHRSTVAEPLQALEAFDEVVDGIKTRLREDRRLGADDEIVWQAGEGGYGIQCDFMVPDEGNVGGEPIEYYARLRFEITQWITS